MKSTNGSTVSVPLTVAEVAGLSDEAEVTTNG
jgi:hypothetical protein